MVQISWKCINIYGLKNSKQKLFWQSLNVTEQIIWLFIYTFLLVIYIIKLNMFKTPKNKIKWNESFSQIK